MPALPSLPALSKAYCTYANISFSNVSTSAEVCDSWADTLVKALTNTLTSGTLTGTRHPNSVWSVVSSSNWTRPYTRATWPATPRSTIILYNANVGLYLLIDHANTTIGTLRLLIAPTLPPLNTQMARNTGVVSQGMVDDVGTPAAFVKQIIWPVTAGYNYNAHITFADDGQFYFLVGKQGDGFFSSGTCVVRLGNSVYPYPWAIIGGSGNVAGLDLSYGKGFPGNINSSAGVGVATITSQATGVGPFYLSYGTTQTYDSLVPDYLSKQRYAYPLTLHSDSPYTYVGYVPDCYYTVGIPSGRLFPSSTSPTHLSLNALLVPYVGTPPRL